MATEGAGDLRERLLELGGVRRLFNDDYPRLDYDRMRLAGFLKPGTYRCVPYILWYSAEPVDIRVTEQQLLLISWQGEWIPVNFSLVDPNLPFLPQTKRRRFFCPNCGMVARRLYLTPLGIGHSGCLSLHRRCDVGNPQPHLMRVRQSFAVMMLRWSQVYSHADPNENVLLRKRLDYNRTNWRRWDRARRAEARYVRHLNECQELMARKIELLEQAMRNSAMAYCLPPEDAESSDAEECR